MSVQFEWRVSDAPKTTQLTGVASRGGVIVASGRRGLLAERTAPGEWAALFTTGPTGNGNGVLDVALTDDADRAWYCGNSGVFGYYDRTKRTPKSHKRPANHTSAFQSVSVTGDAGEERVVVADDDGRFLLASMDGETLRIEQVRIPGDGTAFTEVVDDGSSFYAADAAGFLYRSPNGVDWRRRRLAERTVKSLSVADTGLAAIDESGTVYRDISLFESGHRTKTAQSGIASPEELAAAGEVFVAAGGDGRIVPITGDQEANRPDPGPGVTYYGAEILDDGTIVAGGSSGTITEGVPESASAGE